MKNTIQMSKDTNLFQDFSPTSKAEWLAKVEKDLRGKPLSDLQFHLEKDIVLEPFYHPEDVEARHEPIIGAQENAGWQIGEYVEGSDVKAGNKMALEALNGGATALLFLLKHQLEEGELAQLLAGIELPYISTNFGQYFPGKNPHSLLEHFYNFLQSNAKTPADVSGSIDYDAIFDWSEPPLDDLAQAVRFCAKHMPQFAIVTVDARRFHSGIERTSLELAYTIAKGSEYFAQLADRGIDPATTNQHLVVKVALSTSYFVEIAKLRALKLLWRNMLQAYGATAALPTIEAHFARESHDDQTYTNMVRSATQALSAAVGGVDRLFVPPANVAKGEDSTSFTRRIARNVQHLLQLESHTDKVLDPAAGSYYIEKLTDILAERAWAKFQEIEAQGGYLEAV